MMASAGAGKAAQPPGPPGSSVNGTAAEFANIEPELYDYKMHGKMCKKIAQLTKVRSAADDGGAASVHAPLYPASKASPSLQITTGGTWLHWSP